MILIRSVSRIIERTTPAGLIIGGAVLALSIPQVRSMLRSVAVSAIAGALTLSERIQGMAASGREELEDIVLEAKMNQIFKDVDAPHIEDHPMEHGKM